MDGGTLDIDARLEEWAAPLRQMLEQEEARLVDLRAQVKASETRARRIERTLKAMEPPEQAEERRSKKSKPQGYASEAAVTRVREAFAQREQATVPEIIAAVGLSEPTVRKAVDVLRHEGSIRLAGRGPKNAMLFKVVRTRAVA